MAPSPTAAVSEQEQLVLRYLPLVRHVVADVVGRVPRHVPRDELTAAALYGLWQAARTFDPDRGVGFARHARSRMRGAVLDDLRSRDWASRSTRAWARALRAVDEDLTMAYGRPPTAPEAAAHLGLSGAALARLEKDVHRATLLSYDSILSDAEDSDALVAFDSDPILAVLEREDLTRLKAAVAALPPRMRTVVVGCFFDRRRLADIAVDLGVSESRVCQMKHEALTLLRGNLGTRVGGDGARHPAPAAC